MTTISCLTPPGKAAIATLAVHGPAAWEITRQYFTCRHGSLPETPVAGRYWLGKFGKDHADEVIVAAKADCVEIHCHGGVEVVRMIEELYLERGAGVVPWQQRCDPIVAMLANAPTARTAAILLDQVNGAWDAVTHGDVDVGRLESLISLGQHLVAPWHIAIAGAPNVGKSSLMNALAGYTRSIVSPIPGTTRDVVRVRLAIDGWPVELIDTAGVRESSSELERQGIERAQNAARGADLRFWLLDGSCEPIFPANRVGWHFLINKVDLTPAWEWEIVPAAMRVSAKSAMGLGELCDMISRQLVPAPPVAGEAVPCLPEHVHKIMQYKMMRTP